MRDRLILAAPVLLACVACGSIQSDGGSIAPPPPTGGQGDAGSLSGSGSDGGSAGIPDAGSILSGGGSPDGGPSSGSGGTGGAGGVGGGENPPDAGTAISAQRLTSGEKALVLALDAENVYWATYENAGGWRNWHYRILAAKKSGGIPFSISEGVGAMITWLVARDGFVNWSMATCPESCDTADYRTRVYRQPVNGGPIWQLDVDTNLGQIAVDGDRVYYRARSSPGPGGLWTVRLDGRDNKQLTTYAVGTGPTLDSGALYYFDTGGDPDLGFWSALRTVPASGGTAKDVRAETNTLIWPGFLSLGAGSVFTATQAGFWRAPLDGSKWEMNWGGSNIGRSDVNGGKAYFAQSTYSSYDGCIVRENPNGTEANCIDTGKHSYGDVKVDDTNVYFIRDGDVWRLPRQ